MISKIRPEYSSGYRAYCNFRDILALLDAEDLITSQIITQIKLPTTTVYRILSGLEENGEVVSKKGKRDYKMPGAAPKVWTRVKEIKR